MRHCWLMSPEGPETRDLIAQATDGNDDAREQLIRQYTPLVLSMASRVLGRYIRMGVDDEASVGMTALNQAIDGYQPQRGSFMGFVRVVVRRRLADYWRRRPQDRTVPWSELEVLSDSGRPTYPALDWIAESSWATLEDDEIRRLELEEYENALEPYRITLEDLLTHGPKHRDTRSNAIRAAHAIVADSALVLELTTNHALPVMALVRRQLGSRKTIERHRQYIVAVAVILLHDWPHLRTYVQTAEAGDPEAQGWAAGHSAPPSQ